MKAIKINNIHYAVGDIPYVWMVQTKNHINLYFEESNARKRYTEHLNDMITSGLYDVLVKEDNEDNSLTKLKDKFGNTFIISVSRKYITDYKEY